VIVSLPKAPPELREANRCPWSVIPGEAWGWVEAWRRWRYTGLGPFGGAELGDEPASVAEAILACEEAGRHGERAQELEAMAMMQGLGVGGRPAGGE
jgi:hypothetical protein